jgi:hypothetical protein
MKSERRKVMVKAGLVLMALLALGCSDSGEKHQESPEEAVKLRAQAWADDLLEGDLQGAWAYTSPHFRQFSTSKDYSTYVLGSGRWTSAVVDAVQCAEEVCDVSIVIEYEIKQINSTNRRPLDYKWVRIDGEWWLHVPAK